MRQNGNGLKTDKNGNRTEIKRKRNRITRPVVWTGDGNFFLTPTVEPRLVRDIPNVGHYWGEP